MYAISVLVVLVLLLQHPVLVLIFKTGSILVSPSGWGVSPVCLFFFFLSFSSSSLVSSSLSEVWQFEFVYCPLVSENSSVAHQPSALRLSFHHVGLLGACSFALLPFSGARSEIRQPAPCCQHVMMVC
jgi:hypothetical protein